MASRVKRLSRHVLPHGCSNAMSPNTCATIASTSSLESPSNFTYPAGTSISLMGNMEPTKEELTGPLVVVRGELPRELDGKFIRNGPNPWVDMYGKPYHEFTGDAKLRASDLCGGVGTYSSKFVQTKKLKTEQGQGKPLRRDQQIDGAGGMLGAANTALVCHANKLLALYETDMPYVLSGETLETEGQLSFGKSSVRNVTAHPKVCPETGELIFFGYALAEPKITCGIADKNSTLLRSFDLHTQGGKPTMIHDCAITRKYTIVPEFPLHFEMKRALKGEMPYVMDKDKPTKFAVFPRHAENSSEVRWFAGKSGMTFHIANAWDDEDQIKLVGCLQDSFSFQYGESSPSRLYEWTFDMKSGSTAERELDSLHVEFPIIHPDLTGVRNRYVFAARFVTGASSPFHAIAGCVKYDLVTGTRVQHDFLDGRWGGECVFAPRPGSKEEDDGWLLTYTYEERSKTTELYIIDAKTLAAEPIAVLRTPQRVPFGFHGCWLPRRAV